MWLLQDDSYYKLTINFFIANQPTVDQYHLTHTHNMVVDISESL